ncbi:MAG: hypothetical protein F6J87_04615 [Spirulina sp. SIO3F2]|nr:hypothetical protein [Spirulina sp. SIO3F2]
MSKLTIATSDIDRAGTDAEVEVIFGGNDGWHATYPQTLDNPGDDFERGSIGVYDVNLCYMTDVKSIIIDLSDSGYGPDWHIAWIRLEDSDSGLDVYSDVNHWLEAGYYHYFSFKPTSQAWSNNIVIPQEVLERTPRLATSRRKIAPTS